MIPYKTSMNIPNIIKRFANALNTNSTEYCTLTLILAGLPLVAFLYVDLRLSITVFIVSGIVIGILAIRGSN